MTGRDKPRRPQRNGRVRKMTPMQARRLFDHHARRMLGISGREFLRRWDAGEYADDPDRPGVMHVAMLRHLAR